MSFNIHDKLIHEFESPKGLLYRMIIIYACTMIGVIMFLSLLMGDLSNINFYLFINLITAFVTVCFIRESFNIQSYGHHMMIFRLSLFLLLNSSLFSMAGGVGLLSRDVASMCSALIYAPAMIIIIRSFKKFINYVNKNYQGAVSLSLTDELTGLPNRRHLNNKLREMENRQGTVCIADVDHFKKINDTYGHEVGDKVLRNIGIKLSSFSQGDIFVSRSGGEEFVILIFDNVNAGNFIRNMKSSVSEVCNGSVGITLSIGVAIKRSEQSSSSAISAADHALYGAKEAGRDSIMYAQRT